MYPLLNVRAFFAYPVAVESVNDFPATIVVGHAHNGLGVSIVRDTQPQQFHFWRCDAIGVVVIGVDRLVLNPPHEIDRFALEWGMLVYGLPQLINGGHPGLLVHVLQQVRKLPFD
jgi:hypothetical protein